MVTAISHRFKGFSSYSLWNVSLNRKKIKVRREHRHRCSRPIIINVIMFPSDLNFCFKFLYFCLEVLTIEKLLISHSFPIFAPLLLSLSPSPTDNRRKEMFVSWQKKGGDEKLVAVKKGTCIVVIKIFWNSSQTKWNPLKGRTSKKTMSSLFKGETLECP